MPSASSQKSTKLDFVTQPRRPAQCHPTAGSSRGHRMRMPAKRSAFSSRYWGIAVNLQRQLSYGSFGGVHGDILRHADPVVRVVRCRVSDLKNQIPKRHFPDRCDLDFGIAAAIPVDIDCQDDPILVLLVPTDLTGLPAKLGFVDERQISA